MPSAAARRASDEPGSVRRIVAAERLANDRHEMEIRLGLARLGRPLVGQVDVDDRRDPSRAGGHDHDPRRQEDGLGDRMRHEQDRRPGALPDLEQLHVHALAGHLVERTERLVHQQDRGIERERARDGDALLHATRQLPRIVAGEVPQLDEGEHAPPPARPRRALRRPDDLERQLDVALRPVRQSNRIGRLEDHAVVTVPAGLGGGLAIDRHRARRSASSGRRRSAAASICRTPTGRSGRRTPRAASVRSMPSSALVVGALPASGEESWRPPRSTAARPAGRDGASFIVTPPSHRPAAHGGASSFAAPTSR